MRLKTLKHKTLPDTFGHFIEVPNEDTGRMQWEIAHGSIPDLKPMSATMDLCLKYWSKIPNAYLIPEHLKDYDLIEVDINVCPFIQCVIDNE